MAALMLVLATASGQRCLPPESSMSIVTSRGYSMEGKTVVMTGTSPGTIGHGGAMAMATSGAHIILLGRKQSKLAAVKASIKAATGSDAVQTVLCDLASFASIRQAASAVTSLAPQGVHALVNLAGLNMAPTLEVTQWDITEDGFELQMQVDLIGPALLTELLLPSVRSASPSPGRVISIGSATLNVFTTPFGQFWEPPIVSDWCFMCGEQPGCFCIDKLEAMVRVPSKSGLGTDSRSNVFYALTLKTFWAYHLAQRERGHGVNIHIFHPGFVRTPGVDTLARAAYVNSSVEYARMACPGLPWFVCDCTDDADAAPYRESACPLTIDQGSASLTFLAAAPANAVSDHNGLLTNACEAGEAMEYGVYLDHRLNMAAQRGVAATDQWGLAIFDMITNWATGAPPSDPANFAGVKADCPIADRLGGYVTQLWALLLGLVGAVATCVVMGCCRCCCGGGGKQVPELR